MNRFIIKVTDIRSEEVYHLYLKLTTEQPYSQWVSDAKTASIFDSQVLARGWLKRLSAIYPHYKPEIKTVLNLL